MKTLVVYFSDVVEVLGITERPASTLLGKMYSLELTEKITGAVQLNSIHSCSSFPVVQFSIDRGVSKC